MQGRSRFTPVKTALLLIIAVILFAYIMIVRAFNLVATQGFTAALPHLVIIALFGVIETLLLAAVVDFRPGAHIWELPARSARGSAEEDSGRDPEWTAPGASGHGKGRHENFLALIAVPPS